MADRLRIESEQTELQLAFGRLREWSREVSIGRFEKPTYKNPGELKDDVRLVLDALDALDVIVAEVERLRAELATRLPNQEAMNRRAER